MRELRVRLGLGLLAAACSSPPAADDPSADSGADSRSSPDGGAETCNVSDDCSVSRCPGTEKFTSGAQRCVLLCDKTVRCSDSVDFRQRFEGGEPLRPMGLSDVVDLVGGGFHTCALIEGGTVQCWGDNRFEALKAQPVSEWAKPSFHQPEAVPGVEDAVAISSRDAFYQFDWTCVLLRSSQVMCWGSALQPPRLVPELEGAREIRVGNKGVVALVGSSEVRYYREGGGTTTYRLSRNNLRISSGWGHFCASDANWLECIDTTYYEQFAPVTLTGTIRGIEHTALSPVVLQENGTVHLFEMNAIAWEESTWRRIPDLDGARQIAPTVSFLPGPGVCGLFSDGRILCPEREAE